MNKALFVTPDTSSIIFPQDISSRKEYREKYIGNLYCPTPECTAQLDYVELPFVGHEKIFRTHKGSEHNPNCPYCIIHKKDSNPSLSSETFSQALSDKHIKSILKGLYQRNAAPTPSRAPLPKRGTTRHRDSTSPLLNERHAIPSIDPNAEPVALGKREPSVRKKRSTDLLVEDNHILRGIDGIVDKAYIGEDYIELYFSSTTPPVSLLFYNSFRDKSEQAYRYMQELATAINSAKLKVLVCCLGVVEINTEKAQIQIMSPDYVTIEGLSIYNYMAVIAS